VDEKPRIRRSLAVSYAQSQEFSTITKTPHMAFHSNRVSLSQSLSPVPSLAKTLHLTAFKEDIFVSYLLMKLFEGGDRDSSGNIPCGSLPIEWIPQLVKTPGKPRHKSWDALAAVVFGQAHRSHDVITNAFSLYGEALLELSSKLSIPHNQLNDSTLASMTALYMYEVSRPFHVL